MRKAAVFPADYEGWNLPTGIMIGVERNDLIWSVMRVSIQYVEKPKEAHIGYHKVMSILINTFDSHKQPLVVLSVWLISMLFMCLQEVQWRCGSAHLGLSVALLLLLLFFLHLKCVSAGNASLLGKACWQYHHYTWVRQNCQSLFPTCHFHVQRLWHYQR